MLIYSNINLMHAAKFFMLLLSSVDFITKLFLFKNDFRSTISVSNGLIQHFVGPDVGSSVCKDF